MAIALGSTPVSVVRGSSSARRASSRVANVRGVTSRVVRVRADGSSSSGSGESGAPAAVAPAPGVVGSPMPSTLPMPPMMYPPAQQQQHAYQQGYYYPPAPPPVPMKKKSSGSDVPAWMWVGLGVVLATAGQKIFGAKKQDMQAMMMQQMMKQFTSQAGGAGGMPGMGGAPGMGGGFPPFPASAKPAVDVTPSPPKPAAPKPAAPKPAAAAAATATPAAGRGSAAATRPTEPELRDVSPSPSVASEFGGFADEVVEATPVSSSPFFDDSNDEPLMGSSEGAGAFEEEPSEEDIEYMQNMIRNPEMQKLMYPYLPEFMRNPETFEMLLSNPQYKDQLKDIMKQMKGSGVGGGMGGGMPDINSPEVQEQFAAMGMKPEDVLTQIMSDPELAAAFQNPKVQAAVMDCSTNPMNITKYQNDPEIMGTFEKLAALFPQAGPGGM